MFILYWIILNRAIVGGIIGSEEGDEADCHSFYLHIYLVRSTSLSGRLL